MAASTVSLFDWCLVHGKDWVLQRHAAGAYSGGGGPLGRESKISGDGLVVVSLVKMPGPDLPRCELALKRTPERSRNNPQGCLTVCVTVGMGSEDGFTAWGLGCRPVGAHRAHSGSVATPTVWCCQ